MTRPSHFAPVALHHASRLINHGPTVLAQSRSCTAVGNGTSSATATRITTPTTSVMIRRRDSCWAVVISASLILRSVRMIVAATVSKPTGRFAGMCRPASSAANPII